MSEQWLSIVDYARTYDISDMTIRRRIKSGKIAAVLRDGKYYIPAPKETRSTPEPKVAVTPHTRIPQVVRAAVEMPVKPVEKPAANHPSFHPQEFGHVPSHITTTLRDGGQTTSDARQLLEFCERSMKSNSQLIQTLEDKFSAREKSFQMELKVKDFEIAKLKQQIEDFQVLIKMLEGSR